VTAKSSVADRNAKEAGNKGSVALDANFVASNTFISGSQNPFVFAAWFRWTTTLI